MKQAETRVKHYETLIRYSDLTWQLKIGIAVAWLYGLVIFTALMLGIVEGLLG